MSANSAQKRWLPFGIASRLDGLIWIPLVGLDVATLVLVAQNNGARRYDRMWQTFNTAVRYGLILMIVSGVIVFVFARELLRVFSSDPAIIEIGVVYIRIGALSLWAKPLGFIGFAALRGIKRPLLPMAISMTRMIVLPAIALYALVISARHGVGEHLVDDHVDHHRHRLAGLVRGRPADAAARLNLNEERG